MASLSYANTGSGPLAGAIGWINYGALTLAPSQTIPGVTATLRDGSILTFEITNTPIAGFSSNLISSPTPVVPTAKFGTAGYTGIGGNVAMLTDILASGTSVTTLTISNITLTDPNGIPIPNFNFYVADAEGTGARGGEIQTWVTDGSAWNIVTILGSGPTPVLTGVGTQTATLTSVITTAGDNAPVLVTANPTRITTTFNRNASTETSREGVVIGISINKVQIQKVIDGRLNAVDQFQLNITGTPPATATTTGSSTGLQTVTAYSYPAGAGTFTLSEAMAPGSVSTLSQYNTTVTYTNATPGGSAPPPSGTLPANVNLAVGDEIIATVTNTPNGAPIIQVTKVVNKTTGKVGDILTYTVSFTNVGTAAADNLVLTDPIPNGTAYVGGSISANVPITGDPTTAITFTNSLLPGETVTMTYQVTVTTIPNPNPIPNTADLIYDYVPVVGQPAIDVTVTSNTVTTLIFEPSRGVLFI